MEMLMVLEDFYDKDEFLEYYDFYRIHNLTVANINNQKLKQLKKIIRSEPSLKPKIVKHLNEHLGNILELILTLAKKFEYMKKLNDYQQRIEEQQMIDKATRKA